MHKLFTQMEEFARENHIPIINESGKKIFIDLIAKYNPKRVLEIGTAIGYSSLLIEEFSQNKPEIISLELDKNRIEIAKNFIKKSTYRDKISILQGDASLLLDEIACNQNNLHSFDFIFIDAAKGQYPRYLEKIMPLISKEGVIIADNVLFRNYVLGSEIVPRRYRTIVKRLREYLKMVEDKSKFFTTIYHDGDGITESRLLK